MKEFEQIERGMYSMLKIKSKSHKWSKTQKHRVERRRAKLDLDCVPKYRKYKGYEF